MAFHYKASGWRQSASLGWTRTRKSKRLRRYRITTYSLEHMRRIKAISDCTRHISKMPGGYKLARVLSSAIESESVCPLFRDLLREDFPRRVVSGALDAVGRAKNYVVAPARPAKLGRSVIRRGGGRHRHRREAVSQQRLLDVSRAYKSRSCLRNAMSGPCQAPAELRIEIAARRVTYAARKL